MSLRKTLFVLAAIAIPALATGYELDNNDKRIIEFLMNNDVDTAARGGKSLYDYSKYFGPLAVATVTDVQKAYSQNEIRGNKQYKGKRLLLIGKIDSMGRTSWGNPICP